jgi:hypothetical protein
VTHILPQPASQSAIAAHIGLRRCTNTGCERPARRRGRTCGRCATKAWREKHGAELAAREAHRAYTEAQLRLRRTRASMSTYLRRGQLKRSPCAHCGHSVVSSFFPDLDKPLGVVWLCKLHRAAALDDMAAAKVSAQRSQQHVRWQNDRERFAEAFPRLPADVQTELHARTKAALAADPRLAGLNLAPQAPLARQMLVRIYCQWFDEQAHETER